MLKGNNTPNTVYFTDFNPACEEARIGASNYAKQGGSMCTAHTHTHHLFRTLYSKFPWSFNGAKNNACMMDMTAPGAANPSNPTKYSHNHNNHINHCHNNNNNNSRKLSYPTPQHLSPAPNISPPSKPISNPLSLNHTAPHPPPSSTSAAGRSTRANERAAAQAEFKKEKKKKKWASTRARATHKVHNPPPPHPPVSVM